ncbi:MAG: hypothetical protein AAFY42_02750 [Pseudomonadota bacterium]
MTKFKSLIAAAAIAVSLPLAAPAAAQEFPLVAGEFADVSGIYVEDGGEVKYAQHLADQWMAAQEFAKSKGWISDYKVYINLYPRDGEPNVYLMVTYPSMPDAAESERRNAAYNEWASKNDEQMIAESGDRAEYRRIVSTTLLQEYTKR